VTTVSDWGSLADAFAQQSAPLLIAHAAVLAESDWLAQLASRPLDMWAARPGKLLMLPATAVAEALAILDVDSGAHTFSEAQERLTHHFGRPAEIPIAIDPILVMTQADVDAAEWRLLQGLVKNTDGFMARNVERPMSLRIVRRLASTGVTPNQMTLLSVGIGLCGAPFFLSPYWLWQTVGALLFLAHSILDGCDGELARLKFQESRFGGIIDYWGDKSSTSRCSRAWLSAGACLSQPRGRCYSVYRRSWEILGQPGSFIGARCTRGKTAGRSSLRLRRFQVKHCRECSTPHRAAISSISWSFLRCSGNRTGFWCWPQ
jgi:hypothetical protein